MLYIAVSTVAYGQQHSLTLSSTMYNILRTLCLHIYTSSIHLWTHGTELDVDTYSIWLLLSVLAAVAAHHNVCAVLLTS
jgi:hypothetical protein